MTSAEQAALITQTVNEVLRNEFFPVLKDMVQARQERLTYEAVRYFVREDQDFREQVRSLLRERISEFNIDITHRDA
jgi:hypothetical protein